MYDNIIKVKPRYRAHQHSIRYTEVTYVIKRFRVYSPKVVVIGPITSIGRMATGLTSEKLDTVLPFIS